MKNFRVFYVWLCLAVPLGVRGADVALVDGQNAENVAGQTDSGGLPVLTEVGPFNTGLLHGFNRPDGVVIDTTTHRLFVSDRNTNRVLVFNLDNSDNLQDYSPDHVLGQPDFYPHEIVTDQDRLNRTYGLAMDPTTQRLFVADYSNHRIMVFDVAMVSDGENAINVLGQSNFTSNSAANTVNGMNGPRGVSVDPGTQKLYVSNYANHRITVYDVSVITDGENAMNVLGQTTFTGTGSGTSTGKLKNPCDSAVDEARDLLYVVDYGNNRVLVFDVAAITDGEVAVKVLGQSNFATATEATTQNGMNSPVGIGINPADNILFVSDWGNHRVLLFDVASITNGENATHVIGQPDFTTAQPVASAAGLNAPYGILPNPGNGKTYISDGYNNRVLLFEGAWQTGMNAIDVLGQRDGNEPSFSTSNYYEGNTASGYYWPDGVSLDLSQHRLFVSDTSSNRILVYDLDSSNTLVEHGEDHVIGQSNLTTTGCRPADTTSICNPYDVAIDSTTQQLFVTDTDHARVMVFDAQVITDGEEAVMVLGQPDFTSSQSALTQDGMSGPTDVEVEQAARRLYVAQSGADKRVSVFDLQTIHTGANAINVIGQDDFTSSASGTTQNRMGPTCLSHDGQSLLYVTDRGNHRVLVFDTTEITNGENAVAVLGQTTFTTKTTGNTASAINDPWGVVADGQRNRLYVGLGAQNRILVFDTESITNGESAINVLGQADFTSTAESYGAAGLNYPMALALDPVMNRLYIADQENNRCLIHSVGPVSPSTSTLSAQTGTDPGEIRLSWASAGDDHVFNALTGVYRIQYSSNATTVWDTATTPAGAYTLDLSTVGATPGVLVSTGVTVTATPMQAWHFVLWTQDDAGNWSDPAYASAWPPAVDGTPSLAPLTVTSLGSGLVDGKTRLGDFDGDGDDDLLAAGSDGTAGQLRIYRNNGNGTMDPASVEVAGLNGGLSNGGVAWGDADNDGDLDVLVSGSDGSHSQLRVYLNNGNGTMDPASVEVSGLNGGLLRGGVAWGDGDNDGDLDVLASGSDGSYGQLRVYRNNGNGSFDGTPTNATGLNGGLFGGEVAWADDDSDGDLDIAAIGSDGVNNRLRIFRSNGNGTYEQTGVDVGDNNSGLVGGTVGWGDFDKDGAWDVIACGTGAGGARVNVYRNSGTGSSYGSALTIASGAGSEYTDLAVADFDTDGNPDVAAYTGSLRIYFGRGNGTFHGTACEAGVGISSGSVAAGDLDKDGDVDLVANGWTGAGAELVLGINGQSATSANIAPGAPASLAGTFDYQSAGVSTVGFEWSNGTDTGAGATVEDVLAYDVRIATVTDFARLVHPGLPGVWARAEGGVGMGSASPWTASGATPFGLRTDTTYYFQVRTVDAGLLSSPWSSTGTVWTGVAPATSTISGTTGRQRVTLGWLSAGDDGVYNDLTGSYRVQYATYAVVWSGTGTPTDATTVTIATSAVAAGSAQTVTVTGLTGGLTYYFVLWTVDNEGQMSALSNVLSCWAGDWFDPTPRNVDGINGGLRNSDLALTDMEGDGDLDLLVSGLNGSTFRELRVYKNNGNGVYDPNQIDVDGVGGGVSLGGVDWGDFDNDGDADILSVGPDISGGYQLRVYRNNGNGTIDPAQIEVDRLNGGSNSGDVAWGDCDQDGDLDILVMGLFLENYKVSIYRNNGNGTFNPEEILVDGGPLSSGALAWGDFDNDGDLDILFDGWAGTATQRLRVYKNNWNGALTFTLIEVDGAAGGLYSGKVAWGDFDNDRDLDILAVGRDTTNYQLRVYKNNGNGTIDATQIEVDGLNGGLTLSGAAWGDYDVDGDMDILACGYDNTNRQLRIYNNNGNGTFDGAQTEVGGINRGLQDGAVAWGDADRDGDLDVFVIGYDGTKGQLRTYDNLSLTANSAPIAPGSLSGTWAYGNGYSTATFKWAPSADTGSGPTPGDTLTYDLEISTTASFSGKSVVAAVWSTPGVGNYYRAPMIYDGNSAHGVRLNNLPFVNTTYYYRVRTLDAGLAMSGWSGTGTLYAAVSESVPLAVTNLTATQGSEGQITLAWTAPANIQSASNAAYDVRYSTTGSITNDAGFNNATAVAGEPVPATAGQPEKFGLSGLTPNGTYYFAIKSSNDNGTSPLDVSSPRPSAVARVFEATQVDIDPVRGGLAYGGTVAGDADNDGDLDLLTSGADSSFNYQLRLYFNNGNGTYDSNPLNVDGVNGGLMESSVEWGDYDNDGDLDILVSGSNGSIGSTILAHLRAYRNIGGGVFDPTQLDVDGAGNGVARGKASWGDFDNDGDVDVGALGNIGSSRQLRIYKNNGNGTLDYDQLEVNGLNGGLDNGDLVWVDFDKDGDLDLSVCGYDGTNRQLRVFLNNGNGTMNANEIDVEGANNGLSYSGMAWADFDNDADLDLLVSGSDTAGNRQLRVYKNNGDGTMNATQVEVDGASGGIYEGTVAWGDYDVDGDLDVLVSGRLTYMELRIYKNNGNGTLNATQLEIDGVDNGFRYGTSSWLDYDANGTLDVVVGGINQSAPHNRQIALYKNLGTTLNTAPTAPGTLTGAFALSTSGISVASFTWTAGADSGTGATMENGLVYDLQISTRSDYAQRVAPGQQGAGPRRGHYLTPPKIFNGSSAYGVLLKSTDPWNSQSRAAVGLQTDTTYYYRVKTLDTALGESSWSTSGTVYTGAGPSTTTLTGDASDERAVLFWPSPGDDGGTKQLTGAYRIQYATFTAVWSVTSTPADATTLTVTAESVAPGVSKSTTVAGLTNGEAVHFVMWARDGGLNWSGISNECVVTPSPDAVAPSTSTITATPGAQAGSADIVWMSAGDDGDGGLFTGRYRIQYATYSAVWDADSVSEGATQVLISTLSASPGASQSVGVVNLMGGATTYFVLWSEDEADRRSGVSNEFPLWVGEYDTMAPSSSTLTARTGSTVGTVDLSWNSAGDDGGAGVLTGVYRIQYALGSVAWSATSTPTGATTLTVNALGVVPGTGQAATVTLSAPTSSDYSFVMWTQDEAGRWSDMSAVVTARPLTAASQVGLGPWAVGGLNRGLEEGSVEWGDFDQDGFPDLLAMGTDGSNNELRVYRSLGTGLMDPDPVEIAGIHNGLKSGRAVWGDADLDGDLDVLAVGNDGSERQWRVYTNNGNGTFNGTGEDVAGVDNGFDQSSTAWGDFDWDGDLDVAASGWDGTQRRLAVYRNDGSGRFGGTAVEPAGVLQGLARGSVQWGDYDNDTDMDLLVCGEDGANRQVRVYVNRTDGSFEAAAVNVAAVDGGLSQGQSVFGDFDLDGDLDVVVGGDAGGYGQLRLYANTGGGAFNTTATQVVPVDGGVTDGGLVVGDENQDGYLDLLTAGRPRGPDGWWTFDELSGTAVTDSVGGNNNGQLLNGTARVEGRFGRALQFVRASSQAVSMEQVFVPTVLTSGYTFSAFIKTSLMDTYMGIVGQSSSLYISAMSAGGLDISSNKARAIAYETNVNYYTAGSLTTVNDGNWRHVAGTLDPADKKGRIYVDGRLEAVTSTVFSNVAPAVVAATFIGRNTQENSTFDQKGFYEGVMDDVRVYQRALSAPEVAELASAAQATPCVMRVHRGMGNGTFDSAFVGVDNSLEKGGVAWADVDNDGDLDMGVSGSDGSNPQIQLYVSTRSLTSANSPPAAPSDLGGSFVFQPGSVSVASFTWTPGTDSGIGASSERALTYDVRVSTVADFHKQVVPEQRGSNLGPGRSLWSAKVFEGGTRHGVVLASTNPWVTQTGAAMGLRTDTTYYFQVKTVDAGGAASSWSDTATLWTAVAPSTSTLSAVDVGVDTGRIDLSWDSAGEEGSIGALTGLYRIQYASSASTAWATTVTPTGATTLTIPAAGVSPGVAQSTSVTVGGGIPWYFVLWTQDDSGNWSERSSTVSATPVMRPPVPGSLSYSDVGPTHASGQWTEAWAASTYTLVMSTVADNPPVTVAGSSDTTSLGGRIDGLIPNTTYYGFVRGCNGVGCSAYGVVGATVTWANGAVSLSTTNLTSVSVGLAWQSNGNPAGTVYWLERSSYSGGGYSEETSTTAVTMESSVLPGVAACYRVVAVNHGGVEAAASNEVCATPGFTAPGSGSLAVVGIDALSAVWSGAAGATFYTVRISTLPANPPAVVAGSTTTVGLTAVLGSLSPNTTYYGFVAGCTGEGCSVMTVLGHGVTWAAEPVLLATTSLTSVSVGLAWQSNGNPAGTVYEIESSTDGIDFLLVGTTTELSFPISGLVPGGTYVFRVRSVSHGQVAGGYSNTVTLTTYSSPPTTPVNVRGSVQGSQVVYSWNPVITDRAGAVLEGPVTYEVYGADAPGGPYALAATTASATYGPVPTAGSVKYYRIRAESLSLRSGYSVVIDNNSPCRYVYVSTAGIVRIEPQSPLTGAEGPRRDIVLSLRDDAAGGVAAYDLALIDAESGLGAGSFVFQSRGDVEAGGGGEIRGSRGLEYRDGSRWVWAGAAQFDSGGTARFAVGRTGTYRIMGTSENDGAVQSVLNKVFTPDGDGRGDAVVFRLNNPGNEGVSGSIYDVDGVLVAEMAVGPYAGTSLQWDGHDRHGGSCDGGVYVYEINVGPKRYSGTVVLVR